jgi:hypothetical protein
MTDKTKPDITNETQDRFPPGVSGGSPVREQEPLSPDNADELEEQLRAGERASGFGLIRPPKDER